MTVSLSISDLAKVICPPGSRRRVMALLRAYCDASFTDPTREPGWTAVAGYIGTDETWTEVERQWADAKQMWGIAEFSIAALTSGEVPGIGFGNSDLCIRWFGKIIGESKLHGLSAAINDADWDKTYKSERFPTKYHSCLSMLFHNIDEHMKLEFQNDRVAIVLDPDGASDDARRALCDEWLRESPAIASITFGRRFEYPLLECADLCAGSERQAQNAGGWRGQAQREDVARTVSHALRHRGVQWSLEDQRRVEEILREREERKRRRQREGEG